MTDLTADLQRATDLAAACAKRMKEASIVYGLALFDLGAELSCHKKVYGERFVSNLAAAIGLRPDFLYLARRFAEHFVLDRNQARDWLVQLVAREPRGYVFVGDRRISRLVGRLRIGKREKQ